MKTNPKKTGWFWILINGYSEFYPAFFQLSKEGDYFLVNNEVIDINEVQEIGSEILQPSNCC